MLLGGQEASAVLMVDATVSPLSGGVFHYEFSVINDSLPDLFLVSITDAPLGDPLIGASLVAPAGFLANYDPGLGFLDFIADTTPLFDIGTTSGFAFDSAFSPTDAFSLFEGQTLSGFPVPITGLVNVTVVDGGAVPEPGILSLIAIGLAGWLGGRRTPLAE
jgi:hypothetical protein